MFTLCSQYRLCSSYSVLYCSIDTKLCTVCDRYILYSICTVYSGGAHILKSNTYASRQFIFLIFHLGLHLPLAVRTKLPSITCTKILFESFQQKFNFFRWNEYVTVLFVYLFSFVKTVLFRFFLFHICYNTYLHY